MQLDKSAIPAVFMFQPTEFETLESDRLAEWERALAERVGLVPGPDVQRMPTKSFCKCPDWDDCDAIGG